MSAILNGDISDVRSAIFLIALRMKRETTDENLGVHDAMIESVESINVSLENLVNIADPYDGFTRNIPSSAFMLPVLAELGIPSISQGVETVGPKFGCTHHAIFKLHGLKVNASLDEIAERLENKKIGWGYIDQKVFSPKLNKLMDLRTEIIKRPVVTTIEVLANPLVSKKNHFITGYVHKPYPPIYLNLARNAKFDTAVEEMNVSDDYIIGWQEGYQHAPKLEEQRLTDAYEAGYEDGENNNIEKAGNFKK